MNFEMFIAEQFKPDWGSMVRLWTMYMADQVINLDPDG